MCEKITKSILKVTETEELLEAVASELEDDSKNEVDMKELLSNDEDS